MRFTQDQIKAIATHSDIIELYNAQPSPKPTILTWVEEDLLTQDGISNARANNDFVAFSQTPTEDWYRWMDGDNYIAITENAKVVSIPKHRGFILAGSYKIGENLYARACKDMGGWVYDVNTQEFTCVSPEVGDFQKTKYFNVIYKEPSKIIAYLDGQWKQIDPELYQYSENNKLHDIIVDTPDGQPIKVHPDFLALQGWNPEEKYHSLFDLCGYDMIFEYENGVVTVLVAAKINTDEFAPMLEAAKTGGTYCLKTPKLWAFGENIKDRNYSDKHLPVYDINFSSKTVKEALKPRLSFQRVS